MSWRVLLVDDEPLARRRLSALLQPEPDFEVVAEASDSDDAREALRNHRPDLMFLDIQMPGQNGLEMMQSLRGGPLVVFVTAFDHFAVEAFGVAALDYLLKPFDRARFQTTLSRARDRLSAPPAIASSSSPLSAPPPSYLTRLVIPSRGRLRFVETAEIDWVEAAGNYVQLHCRGKVFLLRHTLRALEHRLDPAQFSRSHRSAIVRIKAIREVVPTDGDRAELLLENDERVPLSRTYRSRILG